MQVLIRSSDPVTVIVYFSTLFKFFGSFWDRIWSGGRARLLAPLGSWSVIWKLCWCRDDEDCRVGLGMGELVVLGITTCWEDVGWTGCGGEGLKIVLPVYLISGKYLTFG